MPLGSVGIYIYLYYNNVTAKKASAYILTYVDAFLKLLFHFDFRDNSLCYTRTLV